MLLIKLSYLIVRFSFTHNCYLALLLNRGEKIYLSVYVIFALTCSLLCSISDKSTNTQPIPSSLTSPSHVHVQSITNPDNSITHITYIFTLSSSFLCHFFYSSKNHQGLVALTERHPGSFEWEERTSCGNGVVINNFPGWLHPLSFRNSFRQNFPEMGY